ncbi:MAG: class B sortase [Lachnospiraceae bacterium]|nr:class B sortase [Lachnospiraceae bacterium]
MRRKKIWLLLAAAAFLAAGVCVCFVWQNQKEKADTQQMYEKMRQEAKLDTKSAPEDVAGTEEGSVITDALPEGRNGTEAFGGSETGAKQKPDDTVAESEELLSEGMTELSIPVDFEELRNMNPDIYAWITVPGTAIDYPVVQNEDNTWYLTRSAEGEDSVAGAIFSETFNEKDFSDVHTVLYGHNMKDGSMFADLHRFEDEEFFEEHREIAVYTPDSICYYRIFAAYLYDDRHLLQSYDCSDPLVFEAYIKEVLEQRNLYAHIDQDVKIGEGDRILTLSTCHSKGNAYRYLVQAVLEKELKK